MCYAALVTSCGRLAHTCFRNKRSVLAMGEYMAFGLSESQIFLFVAHSRYSLLAYKVITEATFYFPFSNVNKMISNSAIWTGNKMSGPTAAGSTASTRSLEEPARPPQQS